MKAKYFIHIIIMLFILDARASTCSNLFDVSSSPQTLRPISSSAKDVWNQIRGEDLKFNYNPQRLKAELTLSSRIGVVISQREDKIKAIFKNLSRQIGLQRIFSSSIDSEFLSQLNSLSSSSKKILRNLLLKSPAKVTTTDNLNLDYIEVAYGIQGFKTFFLKELEKPTLDKLILLSHVYRPQLGSRALFTSFVKTNIKTVARSLELAGWLVNPLPVHFKIYNKKTRNIYEKLKSSPEKKLEEILTSIELHYLEQNHLYEDAFIFHNTFFGTSSLKQKIRSATNGFKNAFLKVPMIFSMIIVGSSIPTTATDILTLDQYVTSRLDEATPQVELILDTSLVPHSALRIGDKVYSPSIATINILHTPEYFANLDGVRQIQTIRLQLSPKEIKDLQSDFDDVAWNKYNNNTFIYDCTTVISDFLNKDTSLKVPALVSSSPTLIMSYFTALRRFSFDDQKLGRVTFVYRTNQEKEYFSILRASVANLSHSIESKIFFVFDGMLVEKQKEIRQEAQLIYKNDVYNEYIKNQIQITRKDLENNFEFSTQLRQLNFLRKIYHQNPTEENFVEVQGQSQALQTNLAEFIQQLQNQYRDENDATLRLDLFIKLEALNLIKETVEKNDLE